MNFKLLRILGGVGLGALLFAIGCGGGSSSSGTSGTQATSGTVQVVMSDDATENWATIGVKVLSISLVPQSGGTPVVVYTAPSTVPVINLLQLDQLGEIIGNVTVPDGTYTSANLTLSANPGDVSLVTSADPQTGFDLLASTTVPSSNIQIKGASGGTVVLPITLAAPLVVTANSTNALDLEFDLKHPAFIVEHYPASATAPIWAINFGGGKLTDPVRHHPIHDLTRLILRHTLGQVTAVSSDNTTITITKEYAAYPVPVSGTEVPIASGISLNILADSVNGTIYHDMDTPANDGTFKNFSTMAATLDGKYVRIAARYQAGGTLVAVRIWASSNFQKIWLSPEGHVVHVNTSTNIMWVTNEAGQAVPVEIAPATQFFFRTPWSAVADTTPINPTAGSGQTFFDGKTPGGLPNVARGFKVHVSAVDPLATTLVADTVDIEIARYDGTITAATPSDFTYSRTFATALDGYSGYLPYIANTTANGTDSSGNTIDGFDWWYFAFPTDAVTNGNTNGEAISDFVVVANDAVSLGASATVAEQRVWGLSYANWGDGTTTNPSNWYAKFAILEPTPLPLGTVSTAASAITGGMSFGMTIPGATPVTVDLSNGSSTALPGPALVYQVNNTGGVVTITQEDMTNTTTFAAVMAALAPPVAPATTPTYVKAFTVPTSTSGTVNAYVLFYYTGTLPKD